MKKLLLTFLVCSMVFSSIACSAENEAAETASEDSTVIEIDGQRKNLVAYNIEDNNYFKLRDIANVLKDTDAKFDVIWNDGKQAIELISKVKYSTNEEISNEKKKDVTPVKSYVSIYLDGGEIMLNAYNIADNNYFKLRDLASAINFGVNWNEEKRIIEIDTGRDYEFPNASGTAFALNTKYLSFNGKTKAYIDEKCGNVGEYLNEYYISDYKNGLMVGYNITAGEEPASTDVAHKLYISLDNLFFNCPENPTKEQIQALFSDSYTTIDEMDDTSVLIANYAGKQLIFYLDYGLSKNGYAFLNDDKYQAPMKVTTNNADYTSVLDSTYNALLGQAADYDEGSGNYGLADPMLEEGNALDYVGYAVRDLSGDGIPELIIGWTSSYLDTDSILAVYTIKNGVPTLTLEGWVRNSYQLKSDGKSLAHHGSGGAFGSCDAIYELSGDGTQLVCVEYYFVNDRGYFYNTTGVDDVSKSIKIDDTQFYDDIENKIYDDIISLGLTPFSQYK